MTKNKKDVRQRSRGASKLHPPSDAAAEAAVTDQSNEHDISIGDAKLIKLAGLLFRGKTQLECAETFGVTDRTIRNWIKRLENNGLPNIGEIDLFAQFQMQLLKDEFKEQQIEELLRNALAQGDDRQAERFLGLQLKLNQLRWARFCSLDPNNAVRTQLTKPDTPSSQNTDNIFNLMTGILTNPSFEHTSPKELTNDDDEEPEE